MGQADKANDKGGPSGSNSDRGSPGGGRGSNGGNTGAGSSQSAAQGRGGQADVGGRNSNTGDSADIGRGNGLGIGEMPDHIAELSPTFDRNFSDEDKKRNIDDHNSANSFQNTLETFASIIGLVDPTGLVDVIGGGLINEYGQRPQQPGESYASYLGRVNAAKTSPSIMENMGFSLAKAAFGKIGKLADIGKVVHGAYSRSSQVPGGTPSQVPGGTPSQSPRRGDNDNQSIAHRQTNTPSIASAPIPQAPEVAQPVKQPFSVGKLDRDRYGLLSALR